MIDICLAPHGSALHAQAVTLRRTWLREPLGLDFTEAEHAVDVNSFHLAATKDGVVVGNVTLTPVDLAVLKLRQMIVEPSLQGQDIGRRLIAAAEELARAQGFTSVDLHARETAIGFYERCGYEAYGDAFVDVTILHRAMRKRLG